MPKAIDFISAVARKILSMRGKGIASIANRSDAESKAGEIAAIFQQSGLPMNRLDEFIKSEKDVTKYLNLIEESAKSKVKQSIQPKPLMQSSKPGDVFDLKGKRIKNTDNIMGGKEIDLGKIDLPEIPKPKKLDPALYEDRGGNIIPAQFKDVTKETDDQIIARIEKQNKEAAERLRNKKDKDPDKFYQGGRAGYVEGGPIYPRLGELSSGVSSAEEQLQQINQSLKTAETNLGESGPGGAGSVTPSVNGYESSGSSLYNESPAGEVTNPYQAPVGMDPLQTPSTFMGKGGPEAFDNVPGAFNPQITNLNQLPSGPKKIDNQGQDPFRDPITGGGQPFYGQPGGPANPYDNGGGLGGLLGEGGSSGSSGNFPLSSYNPVPTNPYDYGGGIGGVMPRPGPAIDPNNPLMQLENSMPSMPSKPGPQEIPQSVGGIFTGGGIGGLLGESGGTFSNSQNDGTNTPGSPNYGGGSNPGLPQSPYNPRIPDPVRQLENPNNPFKIKSIEERKQIAEEMNNSSRGLMRGDGTRVPTTWDRVADGRNTMPSINMIEGGFNPQMPGPGGGIGGLLGKGSGNRQPFDNPQFDPQITNLNQLPIRQPQPINKERMDALGRSAIGNGFYDFNKGLNNLQPLQFAYGGRAGLYQGGQAQIEPDLSGIGHGSDALMARNMLIAPGSQATTSTGLNYLLGEDNDTTTSAIQRRFKSRRT
jgi:hypothetical protein